MKFLENIFLTKLGDSWMHLWLAWLVNQIQHSTGAVGRCLFHPLVDSWTNLSTEHTQTLTFYLTAYWSQGILLNL